jgi:predicted dehydrogenase
MSVRWGIISTGKIAQTFAGDVAHITEGEIVAVGSRTMESASAFAAEFGIERAYGSYAELVNDPDVDAVYIGTPHPMHLADATMALEAGKHVLVEKAFTMNGADARTLVATARERQLFCMEAMWTRFLPHVVAIREIIGAGELGEIVHFEADHGKYFAPDPTHRLFAPELGGSALLDLGVYPISFASMLLGTPSEIHAEVDAAFTGVDATASMVFRYNDSSAHSVLSCTSSVRTATRACISGSKGRIEIDGDFYAPGGFTFISPSGSSRRYDFDSPGRGLQYEAVEVARCLDAGWLESPIMPLDETVAIMDTMDAVLANLT